MNSSLPAHGCGTLFSARPLVSDPCECVVFLKGHSTGCTRDPWLEASPRFLWDGFAVRSAEDVFCPMFTLLRLGCEVISQASLRIP